MQSYDVFCLIPNFFSLFLSKAMDKEPFYGQTQEIPPISVHTTEFWTPKYAKLFSFSSTIPGI